MSETRKPSDIIRSLHAASGGEGLSVGRFLEILGERAFWLAIFLFALITLVAGVIPGVSTVLAVPLLLLSLQIVLGAENAWLPSKIASKHISQPVFDIVMKKGLPYVMKMEKILHPRLLWVSGAVGERLVALVMVAVTAILLVPIPGVHFLPCLGAVILSIGMLERDGVLIIAAVALTIGSLDAMVALIEAASHTLVAWTQKIIH